MQSKSSWQFFIIIWSIFHIVSTTIDYATSRGSKPVGLDYVYYLFRLPNIIFLMQSMIMSYLIIWLSKKILPSKPLVFFAIMSVPLLAISLAIDYLGSCLINDCISEFSFIQMLNYRGTINGVVIIFGFMVKLFLDFLESERMKSQLLSEKNTIELAFLKSQINPHFLFNTLNNLYGLSLSEPDKTPDAIIKLSDMMRYMLYESNVERVLLEQEINYLKSYIDLEKMRYEGTTYIHFDIKGSFNGQQIAPLLLISFIENAFKHGDVHDAQHPLSILLHFDTHHLSFDIKNKIHHKNKDTVGGVGIKNVERRLTLLYPQKHTLSIQQNNPIFEAHLELNLI